MEVYKTPEGYEAMGETIDEAARKIARLLAMGGEPLSPAEAAVKAKLTVKPKIA